MIVRNVFFVVFVSFVVFDDWNHSYHDFLYVIHGEMDSHDGALRSYGLHASMDALAGLSAFVECHQEDVFAARTSGADHSFT